MKLFQSVAGILPNWVSVASDFMKALTNTFMNFLFVFVSIL